MTGGFAMLAYPAEYRNSGIMTFIVGKDGVVYQKDLGGIGFGAPGLRSGRRLEARDLVGDTEPGRTSV